MRFPFLLLPPIFLPPFSVSSSLLWSLYSSRCPFRFFFPSFILCPPLSIFFSLLP
ncbi:hypothetical protein B0T20DRAFT_409259 [Sordaria brevicollis]|uniref:Uncharacterized protein n=1 Tax=Sordaria brevicollis TaxID=83679 RepID=A0AAE0UCW8_SORBR|nr:hypothetical protein B0T20DRAFT_409259 [Sordaria brevicollis]